MGPENSASAGRAGLDAARDPVGSALWLARAFTAGRRLVVVAPGAADHAHHVAVEFIHPVIAGTRPLPAMAIGSVGEAADDDVVLVIGDEDRTAVDLLVSTRDDVATVRAYHLLWELVHVTLEHPGLVGAGPVGPGLVGGASPSTDGDGTGFLYPFLDGSENDETGLRAALADSAEAKCAESDRLVAETMEANDEALSAVAGAVSAAIAGGGRIHVAGNGGSATDAARLARRLRARGVAAASLASDYAVVTALANDVGTERVFARQVEALTEPGDVLVGLSTSGASPNLLAAFAEAGHRGVITVAVTGYGGGPLAADDATEHRLVVESSSVHRIQEAQAALLDALVDAIDEPVDEAIDSVAAGRRCRP